jgi:hypothetical protein
MKTQSILLEDLQDLFSNKNNYFLNREESHNGVPDEGDGDQGEYNEWFLYYRHPRFPEGIFMKETWQTDSYGGNEFLYNVEFVNGKEELRTVFVPV